MQNMKTLTDVLLSGVSVRMRAVEPDPHQIAFSSRSVKGVTVALTHENVANGHELWFAAAMLTDSVEDGDSILVRHIVEAVNKFMEEGSSERSTPTKEGIKRRPPDGYYMADIDDRFPCTCSPECVNPCKGSCGCRACSVLYHPSNHVNPMEQLK